MGVIHRDLKPENILMEGDCDPDTIKIIDFGGATLFDPSEETKLTLKIGTPYYIAPEVLKGTYNEKYDVWSTGVIAFMLLSGKTPFFGENDEISKMILSGEIDMPK